MNFLTNELVKSKKKQMIISSKILHNRGSSRLKSNDLNKNFH